MDNNNNNDDNAVTDFLICGAGPAGASLACFLSEYGLKGIMIASAPSTSDTPRAHITNMAALECLRDIGLEQACLNLATKSDCMEHTRWCHSMAGEEYGRIYSWGHDPKRKGDYDAASPCEHVDLPQTLLEPVLVNQARSRGWDVRFNTTLVTFSTDQQGLITSQIKDNVSGYTYTIRSTYLFGCDGARSQVVRTLGLPLIKQQGGGVAINVLVEADLSHLIKYRMGNLHWTIQPEQDNPEYSWMAIVRMVKPWTQWMFIIFPNNPDVDASKVTEAQWMCEVRRFIGDDSIPAKIINISTWKINEVVAEKYSEGNVFCLGDAVHRHPPFNGLGSNTCIQDAYNLAWKVAYVHKRLAHPSLLDTYSIERQPVGQSVIARANQGFRDHLHVWDALGITQETPEQRIHCFEELKSPGLEGISRRRDLREAIRGTSKEFHALGQEMNQVYVSDAVCVGDESEKQTPTELPDPLSLSLSLSLTHSHSHSHSPSMTETATPTPLATPMETGMTNKNNNGCEEDEFDPLMQHRISTYPGYRLPHAWLNTRIPGPRVSTHDLAGKTFFSLFTGVGGDQWKTAAETISHELGVTIRAFGIGWCLDYEDVYSDWAERREDICDDGVVLVRPDRFVCWRFRNLIDVDVEGGVEEKLRRVMNFVLGWK